MILTTAEKNAFRPPEDISISDYAAKHRMVTAGPAQGLWTNEYTPYLVDPMNAMQLPSVRKGLMVASPQTAKTQWGFNCLLYWTCNDPGPAAYVMPDENAGKRMMKMQLIPMFKKTSVTRKLLSDISNDTSFDMIKFKNGMSLSMLHAGSPASMASTSYKYLFIDEPVKYVLFSGREADPLSLLDARVIAYPNDHKILGFTTPAEDGNPFTNMVDEESDEKRLLYVVCKYCGFGQVMTDETLRWPDSKSARAILRGKLARYHCVSCSKAWDDFDRNVAVDKCFWKANKQVENPVVISWHLPDLNSKMVSLSKIAVDKIRSGKDLKKKFAYVTQHQAKPFKNIVKQKKEEEFLTDHRCDFPPLEVPPDAVLLTAGIDTQQRGFWYVIRAWAADRTSWLIDYGYADSWEGVEAVIFLAEYRKRTGEVLKVWRALIDTGGTKDKESRVSRTEEVYQWLRKNGRGIVNGYKGASQKQDKTVLIRNIDTLPSSNKPIPGGLKLIKVNTDEIKNTIHWRLFRKEGESQRFWVHKKTGMDYVRQFLAQALEKDKHGNEKWVTTRKDDHLKDCENMAAACVDDTWITSFSMIVNYKNRPRKQARPKQINNIEPKRRRW